MEILVQLSIITEMKKTPEGYHSKSDHSKEKKSVTLNWSYRNYPFWKTKETMIDKKWTDSQRPVGQYHKFLYTMIIVLEEEEKEICAQTYLKKSCLKIFQIW